MLPLVDYLIETLGYYPVFAMVGAFGLWVIWFIWPKAGDAVESINTDEYLRLSENPHVLIDVRTPDEYTEGHAPRAVNIPLDQIRSSNRDELAAAIGGKTVVCICATGRRSAVAARRLAKLGYKKIHNFSDGMNAWSAARLPEKTNPQGEKQWHIS